MAPFIGKQDGHMKVHFAKCEIPNTYLDIEFKLSESDHAPGDDSGDEEVKDSPAHNSSAGENGRRYEDEIEKLKEQLQQLRIQNQEAQFKSTSLQEQLELKEGMIQSLTVDKE